MLLQNPATAPPAPTAVPAAPAPATAVVTFTGADGATQVLPVPLSRGEVAEIRAQRRELSNQLTSAVDRRHRLSEEIRAAPGGASRTGLEQRMLVLDKRIVQLESDIAATGRQISASPAALTSSSGFSDPGDMPDNVAVLSGVFTVFVLFPIAISMARFIWRKSSRGPAQVAQLPAETGQRLERLEQGVDAIAIEIERVAEGQRFVTKLLSEQHNRERLPVSGS